MDLEVNTINRPKTSEFLIIYYEFTGIEGAITVRSNITFGVQVKHRSIALKPEGVHFSD